MTQNASTTTPTTTTEEIYKSIKTIRERIESYNEQRLNLEQQHSAICHEIKGMEWALKELETKFK